MRTRLYTVLGLAGAVLVLAGCISLKRTPEARFFVLEALAQPAAAQGRPEEAVEIYAWALDTSERVLGPDSANTGFLRSQYIQYLRSLGRDDEAERLSEG